MLLIREARPADLEQLLELGRILDSVNVPTEAEEIARLIDRSRRSFRGLLRNRGNAVYVFCAEDTSSGGLGGCSMIIAKHGTPQAPHYYMEIATEERYSHTLRRMLRHTFLRLRYSMDGPTELGGLVVAPSYRGHRAKVGKQLSWVRFLYIGKHPDRFQPHLIAEIMPPRTASGSHLFWDHYGRRVTGLSFKEADRLSARDKEFIKALFPDAPLYTFLLPEEVRASIGAVSDQSRPAVALLEQAGLRFLNQIDPFDAGPYYGAPVRDLFALKHLRFRKIESATLACDTDEPRYLIAAEDHEHGFRAAAAVADSNNGRILVHPKILDVLKVRRGDLVDVLALPKISGAARRSAASADSQATHPRTAQRGEAQVRSD
jgi:arginine N-succinyltransferase